MQESPQAVFRVQHRQRYCVIDNNLAQHPTMSMQGRGVMLYLLSKPIDWEVRFSDLMAIAGIKLFALQTIIYELTTLGYMRRFRIRNAKTGQFQFITEVYEAALENPCDVILVMAPEDYAARKFHKAEVIYTRGSASKPAKPQNDKTAKTGPVSVIGPKPAQFRSAPEPNWEGLEMESTPESFGGGENEESPPPNHLGVATPEPFGDGLYIQNTEQKGIQNTEQSLETDATLTVSLCAESAKAEKPDSDSTAQRAAQRSAEPPQSSARPAPAPPASPTPSPAASKALDRPNPESAVSGSSKRTVAPKNPRVLLVMVGQTEKFKKSRYSVEQIETIRKAYPKILNRPDSLIAIDAALQKIDQNLVSPDDSQEEWPPVDAAAWLLARTQLWAASDWAQENKGTRFMKHPATWYNQDNYVDSPSTWNPRKRPENGTNKSVFTAPQEHDIDSVAASQEAEFERRRKEIEEKRKG